MRWLKKLGASALTTVVILFGSGSPAHALFINYTGTNITWSNTMLGGGGPQPIGYVEVDVDPGFTGDIFASDFVYVSDVTYGSYDPFTWNSGDLLEQSSKISLTNGALTDINIQFNHEGTLLALSGPPTANWAIVNSPAPPGVDFPGFPNLDFHGARGDLEVTTTNDAPLWDGTLVDPDIPPISSPTYPASASVEVSNSFIELDTNGGLMLNNSGSFFLTAGLDWHTDIDEPEPWTDRVWFTNVDLNQEGTVQIANGDPIHFTDEDLDPNDNGFTILNGDPFSVNDLETTFPNTFSQFCDGVTGLGIGECFFEGNFDWGSLTFGLFAGLDELDALDSFLGLGLMDFAQQGMLRLSSTFDGFITYQAVTVPVLESRSVPEPSPLLLVGSGLLVLVTMRRRNSPAGETLCLT